MTLIFPKLVGLQWNRKKQPSFNTGVRTASDGHRSATPFMQYPRWVFDFSYDYLPDNNTNPLYGKSDLRALAGLFIDAQARAKTFLYRDTDDWHAVGAPIATADGVTLQWLFVDAIMGGSPTPVNQIDLSTLFTVAAADVDPTTDELHIPGHGLTTGQYPPMFISNPGTLPTPLAANTPYWPIVVDADHIQLAATHSGAAIDITAAGSGTNTLAKGYAIYDNGAIVNPGSASLTLPNKLVFGSPPTTGHAITADFDYYFVCRFSEDTAEFNQFVSKLWDLQKLNFDSEILT